jgi:hypothetical protein
MWRAMKATAEWLVSAFQVREAVEVRVWLMSELLMASGVLITRTRGYQQLVAHYK